MDKEKFSYVYSAPTEEEKREIEDIRRRYASDGDEPNKLERLRRLDALVKRTPSIVSLILGIIGTLIFGGGLSIVLECEGLVLGLSPLLVGGAVMLLGCVPIAAAYPAYNVLFRRRKEKYGEEILRLSAELLENDKTDL